MSAEGTLLWGEVDRIVDQKIRDALKRYRPDLTLATGELSSTRYPTPTGNAPGGYTPSAHTHPWSDITSTPTTLSGYGITDAQPLDSDLTAIAALTTTGYGRGLLTQADAAAARSYIGAGTGSGTVTSVALSAPSQFAVSGSPVASSGTLALAWNNQSANAVFSGPTTGAAAAPTFRALVAGDIPDLDSAKITTGEIPRSPLTTRGDLLTQNPAGTHTRLAVGASGRYLRSDGTDPSWHTLDFADLVYSGLTTGQVLRATGTTATAFGALDLANTNGVTGLLSPANGGMGVNNSARTLAVNTNSGTLDFSAASSTLTIPATGTAALRASSATAGRIGFWSSATDLSHDAALFWDNTNKRLGAGTASPGTLFHLLSESGAIQQFTGYFDSGSVGMAFQRAKGTLASPTTVTDSMTLGFISASGYASTAAAFERGGLLSFEVDGTPTNAGDVPTRAVFYLHTAGTTVNSVVQAMSILNSKTVLIGKTSGLTGAGDLDVAGIINGDSYISLSEMSAPAAPAANGGRFYLEDNGAGKTRAMIKFSSGAAQQIAIQP